MKPFEVYIAFISWGTGGKNRPVLVYAIGNDLVRIYPITTQYESKSEAIRAQYFKITDWTKTGLAMPSYVDTGKRITQPINVFDALRPIGSLTEDDKKRFLTFMSQKA
jgi:hypothetical protein